MNELRHRYVLEKLLKFAGLARSTFYYQLNTQRVADKYASLKSEIRAIFDVNRGRYGYRRVAMAVRRAGYQVSQNTVQRLMGELGLKSLVRLKKYRSYRGEEGIVAPNILARDFVATQPNEKWVTDVTEFNVGGQKLYLSPVLDLFNGEVVAFQTARRPLFDMVEKMLGRAFERIEPGETPILHSDQGWQYRMPVYRRMLSEHSVQDRVPRSGVTEPTEGALWAKEDGHRGSWLTLSLRRPNEHQENHDDQAHYRTDRVA